MDLLAWRAVIEEVGGMFSFKTYSGDGNRSIDLSPTARRTKVARGVVAYDTGSDHTPPLLELRTGTKPYRIVIQILRRIRVALSAYLGGSRPDNSDSQKDGNHLSTFWFAVITQSAG